MSGLVEGSYADFIARACRPLLAAAQNPRRVTPVEAERWWPVILAHSCRLLRLTRPIAIRRHGHPENEGIEWGLERLNDLPLTYRRPEALPGKRAGSPGRLRDVADNVAHAADLVESAINKGRTLPPHERAPLCRQAIGVLDGTAQVVARTTVFDPARAAITDAALRTAAITGPMVSGPQVLLSRLDSMTHHAPSGVDGLGDDWSFALERWHKTATRALREGPSSRILVVVGGIQKDLLHLAGQLMERASLDTRGRALIGTAAAAWDIDWRGIGLAGGQPEEFATAAQVMIHALNTATPHQAAVHDVSILCEQILTVNSRVGDVAYSAVVYGVGTGKLFGRCDLVDPRAVINGKDPGRWIQVPPGHRVGKDTCKRVWRCVCAAENAADRFVPAPPSADRSAAGQVAAVLQALDAARPWGPTPGGRIQVAAPTPAVRR